MFIKQSYCMASKDYFYNILLCLFILFLEIYSLCSLFIHSILLFVFHGNHGKSYRTWMKWERVNNYKIFNLEILFNNQASLHIPSEMSVFCFTGNWWVFELWIWNSYRFFSVLEEHLELFPRASWRRDATEMCPCWHVHDFNLPCGFVLTAVAVACPEALSFEVEKEL